MTHKSTLLTKIQNRTAIVAVIGLGYVGLPLAVAFAKAGFRVIGIDVDEKKVEAVNRGESYIRDVSSADLAVLVGGADLPSSAVVRRSSASDHRPPTTDHRSSSGSLTATTDYAVLEHADVAIICVPTPLSKTRDPDVRYILAAGEAVARHMHPGMLVVLESTTYPGTTEELLLPRLEAGYARRYGESDHRPTTKDQGPTAIDQRPTTNDQRSSLVVRRSSMVGTDFFLAYSPERIDPGNTKYTVENTPKVVGGVTPDCLEVASTLYGSVVSEVVPVSSPAAAEMTKLLENTFRAVNIALVNEVAIMCDKLGLDVWEVIDAAATKPYGFMKFTPGPGVGGHCIPLDPHYLSWKLKTLNYNARFIQLAGEINSEMPRYWVEKVVDALNEQGKPVKGSRVLVLGVAYKKDIDDVRESPALDIIELLRQKGAEVRYHDPHVPQFSYNGASFHCEPNLDEALATADCVIIATNHSTYDWQAIRHKARCIVDTRNVLKNTASSPIPEVQSP